jgi:Predicted solute binding protein
MSTTVRSKEKMSRSKVITLSACVAALAAAVTGVAMIASLNGKEYTAKTMRLLRAEGTVYLVDASGANLPAMDNVRFKSGDALSTGADGLASIGLDESKVVTLRQDSRAEFVKSRKSLELNLTQGELYFNVKEHLADDETFDIRTSTMSVGIRGTSGYVYYDEEGRQNVLITDGCVHVEATNPTTGEAGQIEVSGGHCATVNIYEDRETDSLEFTMTDVTIDDLPDFVVETIANDEELLGRVCEYNGWSRNDIIEAAEQIENADEEKQGVEQTEATAETSVETSETTAESKVETAVEPTATPKPTATPAPTRAPRSNVTPAPTTAAPTTAPTATPTAKPTAAPTATPTQAPQSNSNNSSSSSSTSNEPASTTVPTATPTATPTPEATVTEPTQTSEQTPATEETHETTEDNNQDNVPAQQPVDQTVNEAPASSIPDIREEDLPAGYEMWLWDEANGHFMMAGVNRAQTSSSG